MKIILKITSLLIFIVFIIIALLSYGISTDKFNNKIISQVEQKVPKSKINFKDASISLDLFLLAIKVTLSISKKLFIIVPLKYILMLVK